MSDSIYYQKRGEFKQFIQGLDKTITVRDVIGEWREFKNLSRDFRDISIQQLVENNLIAELYNALRNGMKPETKFHLPYNKEDRKLEIIDNIAGLYSIDIDKAKANIVTGCHYSSNDGIVLPYGLEAAIAPFDNPSRNEAGQIEIIGNVNDTQSIDGGANYFDGQYAWLRKHEWISAYDLRGILRECGFNTSISFSKRRVQCVLYINLLTPRPEWFGGAGKTHIDTRPYTDVIAKTVSSLAYKMPSYYGKDPHPHYYYSPREKSAVSYLRDFLKDRNEKIEADPSLKYRDVLTQSSVWYRIRPIMIRDGFEPKTDWLQTRKDLTAAIDGECQNLFDLEREDLGIYAKAKGMMLYDGNVYPIDFKSIEALGNKGVFILVIEKENIADVEKDAARDSGIALVHTGGRFPKYVKMLCQQAGVPIATLTDYDDDGIRIAAEVGIPRIGIDKDIIQWLNASGYEVRQEVIEEEYKPRLEVFNGDEYLKTKRIELDSITALFPDEPGKGPEALWKYIKYKIEELQKEGGFNYNNVIDDPEIETLYPEVMNDVISKLGSYIEEITEEQLEVIHKGQETVKELISIKKTEQENSIGLEKVVSKDEIMQEKIIPILEKLNEELSKVLDDSA